MYLTERADFTGTVAPVPTKIEQQLREARRLLTEQGWCKNHLRDGAGNYCVRGAIFYAGDQRSYNVEKSERAVIDTFRTQPDYARFRALADDQYEGTHFNDPYTIDSVALVRWNNDSSRKKEDVVALIDATLERVRAEQLVAA